MALTPIQSKSGAASVVASLSVSFTTAPTVGNTITAQFFGFDNGATPTFTVTDNKGNTWTKRQERNNAGPHASIWDCTVATSGGTFTVTVTPARTSVDMELVIAEFVPLTYDTGAGLANTVASPAVVGPTSTLANANELVLAVISTNSGTVAGASGYTNLRLDATGTNQPGSADYKVVSSTAAVSASWTMGSNSTAAVLATYQAAGGGGSTVSGTGSASGTGAASGVGQSTAAAAGSSAGVGAASGVGSSTVTAVGSATGTGTATGISSAGSTVSGVGSAAGTGTATGVGTSIRAATGSAAGIGTASGVGASLVTITAVGTAAGTSSVTGISGAGARGASMGGRKTRRHIEDLAAVAALLAEQQAEERRRAAAQDEPDEGPEPAEAQPDEPELDPEPPAPPQGLPAAGEWLHALQAQQDDDNDDEDALMALLMAA